MKLTSSAFADHAGIPRLYTCEGRNISPPLHIEAVPPAAQSLALIVDDPDAPDPAAPQRVWVHWIVYNLPPDTAALPEGVQQLPKGTLNGKNDWGGTGYGGPCPPIGRHRYFFKLFALDELLPPLHEPSRAVLEQAMQWHVIARAELVGTYAKVR